MKPRMHQAVAIVAAALVMPIAWAQSDQLANPPGTDAPTYVPEPTASPSRTDGADGELANALVEEMNADASLKGSIKGSTSAEAEGPPRGQTATPCAAGISAIVRSVSSRKIGR